MRFPPMATMTVLAVALAAACSVTAAPILALRTAPPPEGLIGNVIRADWSSSDGEVQFRFKLDAPGDWMGGLRYALNKWSTWGDWKSVHYSDFVLGGTYILTVEARDKQGEVARIASKTKLQFVEPTVRDAGIKIDWARVRNAGSNKDKYQVLAAWRRYLLLRPRPNPGPTVDPSRFSMPRAG